MGWFLCGVGRVRGLARMCGDIREVVGAPRWWRAGCAGCGGGVRMLVSFVFCFRNACLWDITRTHIQIYMYIHGMVRYAAAGVVDR